MNKMTNDWAKLAGKLQFRHQLFIDGKFAASASGKTFPVINPATGKELAQIASGEAEDVDRAVRSARSAFEDGRWSRLEPADRKRRLLRLAELMRTHAEELALLETLNMGKPISDSLNIDIPASANCIAWNAEAIDKLYGEIAPTGPGALALVSREPLGVVGAVVPWNFPLLMACWKLGPALAAGNSVVLKPAEQSPQSVLRLAELAIEAGIPDGVFNVVTGYGETAGKALGLHMDVDAIAFTGSTEVGKYFMEYSARSNMKRVSLECGGKTPHIIMRDCPDLDAAAKAAAFGIFFNQGEVCNAGSRLLVDHRIKDQLLEKIIAESRKLIPGDPLDEATTAGAIVTETQMKRVLDYIGIGEKEGAKLVLGGSRVRSETGGYFVEPTIFDQVQNNMRISQEEIFGPVLSTISFETPEEAVRIANASIYGLAAAVWTKDIDKAIVSSRRLRAGVVWVNCFDEGNITVPFGGFKQSGFGRDKSLHAIEKYTDLKTTWIKVADGGLTA
jgi:gamma-glutamyl-gamma-aminobutyraldehyde dehydrogenase/4-guanidinobutyraldehyde dehydrogenase/NAD-dependent aldehyde dehydrogenase